jgi:isocitrate dehydrogenase (NAD+)
MTTHLVTLIPGDGTGPELTEATRRVLEAAAATAGSSFDWDVQEAGVDIMETAGTPLPEATLESVRKTGLALKGPITTPIGTGFRSVNVALRYELDLYACIRPCKTYEGMRTRFEKVDVVIVRENTEDLYAGIEYAHDTDNAKKVIEFLNSLQDKQIREHSGISIKPMSEFGSRRIIRYAFEYARDNGRKRVHCVTKSNINGDILSDLTAGMVGGLGVAPGGNIGVNSAVFEATHGSAPKYKGLNKVNPTAMILSGEMLLRHVGEIAAADNLERAVSTVIAEGTNVTYDLKPNRDDPSAVGTSEYADAIIEKLEGMKA